jgi:hypothetical protein
MIASMLHVTNLTPGSTVKTPGDVSQYGPYKQSGTREIVKPPSNVSQQAPCYQSDNPGSGNPTAHGEPRLGDDDDGGGAQAVQTQRGVALQVAFERQILKPGFTL